jgi:hypothetical protein
LKIGERLDAQHKHNLSLGLDPQTIWSWAALIAAALIIFWVTRGAQYHQLALRILFSSIALIVALLLFEALWRLLEAVFDTERSDATDG